MLKDPQQHCKSAKIEDSDMTGISLNSPVYALSPDETQQTVKPSAKGIFVYLIAFALSNEVSLK